MNKRATIIFSKQIKEKLEDYYNIYPIAVIPNPFYKQLNAWVFASTKYFQQSLTELSNSGKR